MRTLCLILASSTLVTQFVWAEEVVPGTPKEPAALSVTEESESQQFARARLMDMARFLASQDAFSVTLRVGYDVVQDSGQKIEFGEIRDMAVQRPNHVRIEERASHGGHDLMLFDGTNITTLHGEGGVYAQTPQPGDLDATVMYFVRDLQMRLPLAPMLMTRFPQELQRRVQSIAYVGSTETLGKRAHHIAARTANVDFQVWIADGERPLPLRIVLTYTQADGQPQFWADFSKWDLSPRFEETAFEFQPPAGAKQIAFAVHLALAPASRKMDDAQETGERP